MADHKPTVDLDPEETQEWLESLAYTLRTHGPKRVRFLLDRLEEEAKVHLNVDLPFSSNTPAGTVALLKRSQDQRDG